MSENKMLKLPTSESDKLKALQSAVHYLCERQPFFGGLMQQLVMRYTHQVPTAGIHFNKELEQFEVSLNANYFCNLSLDERVAVLHHEILHFTNRHLFRMPFLEAKPEDRKLYNIAGDMAINQYIHGLPAGCVDVKDWQEEIPGQNKSDPKTLQPFPKLSSMETYYDLIKKNKKANKDTLDKYKEFDVHDWEKLDEATKQKMLEEAKKVIQRTIEKSAFTHSSVPDSIKDLLKEIEVLGATINYKQILSRIIKRTVSATNRESTWKRPNKRYGIAAPGTKIAQLPKLSMFVDTSGSISHTEINEFLDVISGFLKAGSRDCFLILWHTLVYSKKKFKLHNSLLQEEIESGGTAINCVFEEIKKSNPNLSIILTDGYYDTSTIVLTNEIIWVISKGGNKEHYYRNIGKTILLEGLV